VFRLFHNYRKRREKEIEPHEVFLDNLAQRKEEEYGTSKRRLEVSLSPFILKGFSFLLIFLFLLLLGRSFQLQLIDNEQFSALATRNISSIASTQLLRGVIYDRNLNQLVYNSPQHDLYFRGRGVSNEERNAIKKVAEIIGKEPKDVLEKIAESDSATTVIERGLDHESLVKIQAREDELTGFFVSSNIGREYVAGDALAHVLGYIGKIDEATLRNNPGKYTIHDYTGKMGVERFYESNLTRADQKTALERDAAGNIISTREVEEERGGENLVLTIDLRLQEIVKEKTKEKLEELDAQSAAVVALDPNNGDVLAMLSEPGFDSNIFRKRTETNILQDIFENGRGVFINRTTSAGYPTGSVIKPILGVAALEEGIITPEKQIFSPGYISIPNPWNPSQPTIFRDYQAHGWRDMREAIGVSSNVYFYAIGGGYEDQEGLGVRRIRHYLNLFGWEERTGIDLPGEKKGFIPSPEWKEDNLNDIWRVGDTYNLSIGQGYLTTTPLQAASSYAALVNGGRVLSPRILKEIIDDEGNSIKKNGVEVRREDFVSPENLEVVKEGMRKATTMGTARSLQALPVEAGAKTGTSQTSVEGKNINWVTVFAPYDDPEIVITTMIKGVEGVTPVSTHLTRDILLEYYEKDEE